MTCPLPLSRPDAITCTLFRAYCPRFIADWEYACPAASFGAAVAGLADLVRSFNGKYTLDRPHDIAVAIWESRNAGSKGALRPVPPPGAGAGGSSSSSSTSRMDAIRAMLLRHSTAGVDLAARLPEALSMGLLPFQKDGVKFCVARNGRALIADDMGLGKTVQAIATATYFSDQWPLLVVAPASVCYNWRDELTRFIPGLRDDLVYLIKAGSKDGKLPLPNNYAALRRQGKGRGGSGVNVERTGAGPIVIGASSSSSWSGGVEQQPHGVEGGVCILSFEQVTKRFHAGDLAPGDYKAIIVDESHNIKSLAAKRSKALVKLCQAANMRLLLSGTPALNRPCEIFNQVAACRPDVFPSYDEFAVRYCNRKPPKFGVLPDDSGHSNEEELSMVLQEVMIRRRKKDVLQSLPKKGRMAVHVRVTSECEDQLRKLNEQIEALRKVAEGPDKDKADRAAQALQQKATEAHRVVGVGKIDSTFAHIKRVLLLKPGQSWDAVPSAAMKKAGRGGKGRGINKRGGGGNDDDRDGAAGTSKATTAAAKKRLRLSDVSVKPGTGRGGVIDISDSDDDDYHGGNGDMNAKHRTFGGADEDGAAAASDDGDEDDEDDGCGFFSDAAAAKLVGNGPDAIGVSAVGGSHPTPGVSPGMELYAVAGRRGVPQAAIVESGFKRTKKDARAKRHRRSSEGAQKIMAAAAAVAARATGATPALPRAAAASTATIEVDLDDDDDDGDVEVDEEEGDGERDAGIIDLSQDDNGDGMVAGGAAGVSTSPAAVECTVVQTDRTSDVLADTTVQHTSPATAPDADEHDAADSAYLHPISAKPSTRKITAYTTTAAAAGTSSSSSSAVAGGGAPSSAGPEFDPLDDPLAKTPKLVVFAHHHEVTNALLAKLKACGIKTVLIDGRATALKKHALKKSFQEDPSVQVALIGIKAAGVGLSFVAAKTAVFAELDWVPGALMQAEDRIHRLGQQAPFVHIHYLLAGPINGIPKNPDEMVWTKVAKKLEVLQSCLDAGERIPDSLREGYEEAGGEGEEQGEDDREADGAGGKQKDAAGAGSGDDDTAKLAKMFLGRDDDDVDDVELNSAAAQHQSSATASSSSAMAAAARPLPSGIGGGAAAGKSPSLAQDDVVDFFNTKGANKAAASPLRPPALGSSPGRHMSQSSLMGHFHSSQAAAAQASPARTGADSNAGPALAASALDDDEAFWEAAFAAADSAIVAASAAPGPQGAVPAPSVPSAPVSSAVLHASPAETAVGSDAVLPAPVPVPTTAIAAAVGISMAAPSAPGSSMGVGAGDDDSFTMNTQQLAELDAAAAKFEADVAASKKVNAAPAATLVPDADVRASTATAPSATTAAAVSTAVAVPASAFPARAPPPAALPTAVRPQQKQQQQQQQQPAAKPRFPSWYAGGGLVVPPHLRAPMPTSGPFAGGGAHGGGNHAGMGFTAAAAAAVGGGVPRPVHMGPMPARGPPRR